MMLITVIISSLFLFTNEAVAESCTIASRGLRGVCDVIDECPQYVKLRQDVRAGLLPRTAELQLQSVICGYRGIRPLLCCARDSNTAPSQVASISPISFGLSNRPPNRPVFQSISPQQTTFNRPPTTSFSRPLTTSFSRPSTTSFSRPSTTSFVRPSITSFSRPSTTSISRPSTTSFVGPFGSNVATQASTTSQADLLPSNCGVSPNPDRIVGGKEASLGAWPWMAVLIGSEVDGAPLSPYCGGSLISSLYIITAAHCIPRGGARLIKAIRLGEHDFRTDRDCEVKSGSSSCAPRPQDIRPEAVIVHPEYNKCQTQTFCNDIALIRLSREATIKDYVRPICLPRSLEADLGYSFDEVTLQYASVAGWGSVNQNIFDLEQSPVLKDARVQIQVCRRREVKGVLCAAGNNQGSCRGDSGAPMMLSNRFGTRFYAIGVTSKGSQLCGSPGVQVRYTALHLYVDWIIANLQP